MLAWLTDPFQNGFTQRALLEVLVLALACGPLGVWILLYRQSYAAESISPRDAARARDRGAGGRAARARRGRRGAARGGARSRSPGATSALGGDAGVAVAVSALFGLGALLALSPEAPPRLQELLFGDLLGASLERHRGGRGPGGRRAGRARASRTGG